MREKLQTLPLAELRELARSQGLKGISALRKAEIIDLLCQKEESGRENSGKENSPAAPALRRPGLPGQPELLTLRGPAERRKRPVHRGSRKRPENPAIPANQTILKMQMKSAMPVPFLPSAGLIPTTPATKTASPAARTTAARTVMTPRTTAARRPAAFSRSLHPSLLRIRSSVRPVLRCATMP
jgi:hypothetical protein